MSALKAEEQKALGNEAYKKRDFESALAYYDKAIEIDPTNISYYSNKAATKFEQGQYKECVLLCEKAVEIGREHQQDFKLLAKAFSRAGNACMKLDDLDRARHYFNKSLTEHRDHTLVKKINELDKEIKERKRKAYLNPEIALEEKDKGNKLFKEGKYADAVQCYTESIQRNPDDAKVYSNRAACYTKLMEFQMALTDCDECLKLDPTFVKGYLRKAAVSVILKNTSEARKAYEKALEFDPNCTEAKEGLSKTYMSRSADAESVEERVRQDPEVRNILSDPSMRVILQQMQDDPKAVQEHLKNPDVMEKVFKLMDAGVLQMK